MRQRLALPVYKETRALLPTWLAGVSVLVAAAVLGDPRFDTLALVAYSLAAIALGALSIGREYGDRTLSLLLSQPVDRRHLLLTKSAVLAVMLMTLAAAYGLSISARIHAPEITSLEASALRSAASWIVVPVLAGLFLAPALTMLSRGAMAGIVFTVAVLSSIWWLADTSAFSTFGSAAAAYADREVFRRMVMWRAMAGVSALAAVVSWRMFVRLEAVDGRGREVRLPGWLRTNGATEPAVVEPPSRRRHPIQHLVVKELHLQHMTIAVGGLYIMWWGGMALARQIAPDALSRPLDWFQILYVALLSLLAGSLASAEERQLGTLEWQVLQPVGTRTQWAVKAGTTLALVTLLGAGLPALLAWLVPSPDSVMSLGRSVVVPLVLATIGLYVSSFSSTGVGALLLSLPVTVGLALFIPFVAQPVAIRVHDILPRVLTEASPPGFAALHAVHPGLLLWAAPAFAGLLLLAFVVIVLRFALVNHRSAERYGHRIWRQAAVLAGSLVVGAVLQMVVHDVTLTMVRDRPRRALRQDAPTSGAGAPIDPRTDVASPQPQ